MKYLKEYHNMKNVRTFLIVNFLCSLINFIEGGNLNSLDVSNRIIGGTDAEPHEFPYLVIIRTVDGILCGGSILNNRWVLTAAHCTNTSTNFFRITAGEHDLASSDGMDQTLRVERIFVHPNFNITNNWQFDIALMLMQGEWTFTNAVQPVALEPIGYVKRDTVTIMGWGSVSRDELIASPILQKIEVPIVNQQECVDFFPDREILDSNLCVGNLNDNNTPSSGDGDSGGPVICTSACGMDALQCGIVATRVVNTRITSFLPFIQQTIADNTPRIEL